MKGLGWLGWALLVLWISGCRSSEPEPPNVLMIVLDTVRADHLSTYGYPRETSPNLTRLAEGGVRFTDVLAPAPWTVPSHASMMTGKMPAEHGAHHEHPSLREGERTLAARFAEAGYRTGLFSANPNVGPMARLEQGFAVHRYLPSSGAPLSEAALDFIAEGAPRGEPFFVFINYMEAHMPYPGLPESTRLAFQPGTPERTRMTALDLQSRAYRFACEEDVLPAKARDELVGLYDAAIAHLDDLVGRLLASLGDDMENTLVVVLSDHGELLGEAGLVEHQWSVLEPLLHVPLILSWPRGLPGGRVVDMPISLSQVHDMVLHLAGLVAGPGEFGVGSRSARVAEYYRPLRLLEGVARVSESCAARLDRRLISVRDDGYELVLGSDGQRALYDLSAPLAARRDLSRDESERSQALEALARERWALSEATAASEDRPPDLDARTREHLEALGYLLDESRPEDGRPPQQSEAARSSR